MPRARGDLARRFDNQDAMCFRIGRSQRTDFAVQLITKNPNSFKSVVLYVNQLGLYISSKLVADRLKLVADRHNPHYIISLGE